MCAGFYGLVFQTNLFSNTDVWDMFSLVYFVQLIHTAWGDHPTGCRTRQDYIA
jgi:hypothetical protein